MSDKPTPKPKTTKACTCVAKMQRELQERNTVLVMAFFTAGRPSVPTIATMRIKNLRDGKQAVTVLPSFCPFCGVEYPS